MLSISALNSNGNHIKKYLAFLKILELPSEIKVEFSILSCQVDIPALIHRAMLFLKLQVTFKVWLIQSVFHLSIMDIFINEI